MGQFAKLSGLVGLAALLAAPAPAFAAPRHAGFAFRPVQGSHVTGRPEHQNREQSAGVNTDSHRGADAGRRGFRRGYGFGYGGYYFPWDLDEPYYPAPTPYPADYDNWGGAPAGYYGPAGYGVIYNTPPIPPLWRRPGPRIIYLSGRHFHHRHFCARRHGVTVVRGGHVSVE